MKVNFSCHPQFEAIESLEEDTGKRGFFYDSAGEIYLVHGLGISKLRISYGTSTESYSFKNARKVFPPLRKITKGVLTFDFDEK